VVIVFYGVLSGFGKMLFGKPEVSPGSGRERGHAVTFTVGGLLSSGIMIIMAVFVMVMGFHVPGFIDRTIRTCVQVFGVK
jgi:hypothetical protein